MFQTKSSLVPGGVLLALMLAIEFHSAISAEISIGHLYECSYDMKGEVVVKNDREIVIKGYNYDGTGPHAWFHGQLKGAKGIYLTDKNYVTLPFPGATCEKLQKENKDISLILPRSIKEFATIGVLCYKYCSNFGHIVIPDSLYEASVDPAPADLQEVKDCNEQTDKEYKDDFSKCPLDAKPQNKLHPNCKGGNEQGKSPASNGTTDSAASQLLPSAIGLIAGSILAAILRHL